MESFLQFISEYWRDGVEILILTTFVYSMWRYFRATRGARILVGLVIILIALTFVSDLLRLEVIGWLLSRLSFFLAIGLVVIFQPELRRALAELGSRSLFYFGSEKTEVVDQICDTVVRLSNSRVGALIAISRQIDLGPYAETGVNLNADFSDELVRTIFQPPSALHDGGLIVENGILHSAGCIFPVSQRELADRSLGLRHRAGIGISEETDAIAIVVSEETGSVSLCLDGNLEQNLKPNALRARIEKILKGKNHEDEDDLDDDED